MNTSQSNMNVRRARTQVRERARFLAASTVAVMLCTSVTGLQPVQALLEKETTLSPEDLTEPVPIAPAGDLPVAEPIAQIPFEQVGTVWTGFDYAWQRELFGFVPTPHRVGSIGSVIWTPSSPPLLYDNALVSYRSSSTMQFTLGKDGDFAFPEMRYGAVYSPNIRVKNGATTVSFEDDGNDDPVNPIAFTTKRVPFSVPLDSILSNGTLDHYTLVLRGFNLAISCPPGLAECESTAMWPHELKLAVENCAVQTPTPSSTTTLAVRKDLTPVLACEAVVDLGRSWTPGDYETSDFNLDYVVDVSKPFEDRLAFDVDLHYSVIGGNAPDFYPTDPGTMGAAGHTHCAPMTTYKTVTLQGGDTYPFAMAGLRGFRFTLNNLEGHPPNTPRGRYLQALTFFVSGSNYNPASGTLDIAATTGYRTPRYIVIDSVANYDVYPVVLQFAGASAGFGRVTGQVCGDGTTTDQFNCDPALSNGFQNNLEHQFEDTVETGIFLNHTGQIEPSGPVLELKH